MGVGCLSSLVSTLLWLLVMPFGMTAQRPGTRLVFVWVNMVDSTSCLANSGVFVQVWSKTLHVLYFSRLPLVTTVVNEYKEHPQQMIRLLLFKTTSTHILSPIPHTQCPSCSRHLHIQPLLRLELFQTSPLEYYQIPGNLSLQEYSNWDFWKTGIFATLKPSTFCITA